MFISYLDVIWGLFRDVLNYVHHWFAPHINLCTLYFLITLLNGVRIVNIIANSILTLCCNIFHTYNNSAIAIAGTFIRSLIVLYYTLIRLWAFAVFLGCMGVTGVSGDIILKRGVILCHVLCSCECCGCQWGYRIGTKYTNRVVHFIVGITGSVGIHCFVLKCSHSI